MKSSKLVKICSGGQRRACALSFTILVVVWISLISRTKSAASPVLQILLWGCSLDGKETQTDQSNQTDRVEVSNQANQTDRINVCNQEIQCSVDDQEFNTPRDEVVQCSASIEFRSNEQNEFGTLVPSPIKFKENALEEERDNADCNRQFDNADLRFPNLQRITPRGSSKTSTPKSERCRRRLTIALNEYSSCKKTKIDFDVQNEITSVHNNSSVAHAIELSDIPEESYSTPYLMGQNEATSNKSSADNSSPPEELNESVPSFETNATLGSSHNMEFEEFFLENIEPPESKLSMAKFCFVDTEKLISILEKQIQPFCENKSCGKRIETKKYFKGAHFHYTWKCKARPAHTGSWVAATPDLNLRIASSVLYSGSSFSKLETFFSMMGAQIMSDTTLYKLQDQHCYSSVLQLWDSEQVSLLNQCRDPLLIACDARNDSPGYCAKYCTYTAIDMKTSKIVAIEFAEKSETNNKSPNMEALCLRKLLTKLEKHCTVREVVTDAHPQVKCILRDEYPHIIHSFDIWHASKNLRKRLEKTAKKANCSDIKDWVNDLVNHFWFSSENCYGDANEMRRLWLSALHHITNEHEWGSDQCYHEEISEEEERGKNWINYESVAYEEMHNIICDKDFLNGFEYYANFRHTGALESFHSVILAYALKKLPFGFKSYVTRNLLAVLDHNSNVHRPQATTKDGSLRFKPKLSKSTSKWTVVPVKVPKRTSIFKELLELTLAKEVVRENKDMFPDNVIDPKTVKIKCPPKPELIKLRMEKSRFSLPTENFNLEELLPISVCETKA